MSKFVITSSECITPRLGLIFTCPKSAIETLEQLCRTYSKLFKTPERSDVFTFVKLKYIVLVFLLLTLRLGHSSGFLEFLSLSFNLYDALVKVSISKWKDIEERNAKLSQIDKSDCNKNNEMGKRSKYFLQKLCFNGEVQPSTLLNKIKIYGSSHW